MKALGSLTADWSALSTLLDEMLALAAPQRPQWLAALSPAHAAHRVALEALMRTQADVETRDLLAGLPALRGGMPPVQGRPSIGDLVGPYRLLAERASGGMGTVWLAERADLRRRVALKLPRIVWGGAFAERLAREREILATLEHPHIARLYDAGLDAQDRPYLAMEYVEGRSIDAYCAAQALSLAQRVALLLQVAAAVAHAHGRLVVHRDLKPDNILVTGDGQVKLLDFGIAKLIDDDRTRNTALTAFAGRPLTLDYASPEQVRGEALGTATDVYSLGVVAYELLACTRPYRLRRGSAAELEEAIASADPPAASAAASDRATARALRGDGDAILAKALHKLPAQRYPTMDAFARDLRRWQAGEPVEARPERWSYRAAKYVRRHRLQVTAGTLVVVALVAGTSVALWQAREARAQAARAETEARTATAVEHFIEGVFRNSTGEQADPMRARATTARELLDRGADRIDTELADAPAARLRLLALLADMYEGMDLTARQIELLRKALDQAQTSEGPTAERTVEAMADLANALTIATQRGEAMRLLADGAAILDARGDHTSHARFRIEVMQASLERRTDPRKGVATSERAVALARRHAPDAELLLALQVLADNATFTGDLPRAEAALSEIVAVSEAHPPLGATELALIHAMRSNVRRERGDFAAGEADMRRALAIQRARGADAVTLHQVEIEALIFLQATGRLRESLDVAEPAWRWAWSTDAASHRATARWMKLWYGRALIAYGRPADGLAATDDDESMTIDPKLASGLDVAALADRARALTALGRLVEARAVVDRARWLLQRAEGRLAADKVDVVERAWLVADGRAAAALAAFEAAAGGASSTLQRQAEAAWLQWEAGHVEPARSQAERVLATLATDGTAAYHREEDVRASLVLGRALSTRQPDAARPVLEHALEVARATYDPASSAQVRTAVRALDDVRRVAKGAPSGGPAAIGARGPAR